MPAAPTYSITMSILRRGGNLKSITIKMTPMATRDNEAIKYLRKPVVPVMRINDAM